MIKIYYSSIYFKSIAEGLGWLISRYNKTLDPDHQIIYEITSVIKSYKSTSTTWIILGLQNAPVVPAKYIVWNFEQFEVDGPDFDQTFWDRITRAHEIWDYSKENIRWLDLNKNMVAKFFPLGWFPFMKFAPGQCIEWSKKEIEFSFIGLMNERRRDIIKPLHTLAKAKSWNMYLSNKCWEQEFESIYSNTKFALNIHYYPGKTVLEVHRIIPLILNNIWVISEKSGDPWYNELFEGLVTWAEPDTFAQVLEGIELMDEKEITGELGQRQRNLIQLCDSYKYFLDGGIVEKLQKGY
jgi:hypothetical protein